MSSSSRSSYRSSSGLFRTTACELSVLMPSTLVVGSVPESVHDPLRPVPVGPHLRGGTLHVVRGPAEADLSGVVQRPGRAGISVEGHADAAGIDEVRVVRARPPEL